MDESSFRAAVDDIVDWFAGLNPYDFDAPILKVEDYNYGLSEGAGREALYCWAVSAKRYALCNLDSEGLPVIRKASAHGLGHFMAPYGEADCSTIIPPPADGLDEINASLWQHDLWWRMIQAANEGNPDQVDLTYHSAFERPAVSKYGAQTPKLLDWFKAFNRGRPYSGQVKPGGFLLTFFADPFYERPGVNGPAVLRVYRPIAPYDRDYERAVADAFDRETGEGIPADALRPLGQALRQYHLQSEHKFLNGEGFDRGPTTRRHIVVAAVRHIGKEANRLEEQALIGLDPEAQPDYGWTPDDTVKVQRELNEKVSALGKSAIAQAAGFSRGRLDRLLTAAKPNVLDLAKLVKAANDAADMMAVLEQRADRQAASLREEIDRLGLRATARRLGEDPSNLSKRLRQT